MEEVEKFQEEKKEITKHRSEIEKKLIVHVNEFEKFPGEIAKHFHGFCDTINPIVKKAVYFFILNTDEVPISNNTPSFRARRTMENLWSKDMGDHELNPLITRLSNYIIDIIPEDKC